MSLPPYNIKTIDSHTGGEPTRMVYEGFPKLKGESIKDKLSYFKQNLDHIRKSIILEPRGNDVLVGALLCEASNPKAATGVIFFNNSGYLGMCGHGSIGVIISLAYQGKIQPGEHYLETPVGLVKTVLHEDGSCSVENVPSYRYAKQVEVTVPGFGSLKGDVAWGGNWFFLVNEHNQKIASENVGELTQFSLKIKKALSDSGITGEGGAEIDHIELFAKSEDDNVNSKSFVLCPGAAYDRSPCGTGTSAKLACLAADGSLQEGELWVQQSVIGSLFQASYQNASLSVKKEQTLPPNIDNAIIPTIRGRAYVCAETVLIIQQNDPFKWGITL
ncbi:proline racemase family protein [Psychrobacter lutiphocae]|uniref:proline racemase family protein n=1 Tax=Psychrobacter lutiphocae TaxID=540500 RepID=UPI000370C873|nr:proline racemase family protein [Psychrobacter lutiphocae]